MKKSLYGPIVMGMAALMVATPVLSATTVKADTTNSSAITQSGVDGNNALNDQLSRIDKMEDSGKYNKAQKVTLDYMRLDYIEMQGTNSDNELMQKSYQLKSYIDKGVVGYSVDASSTIFGHDVSEDANYSPSPDSYSIFTFDAVNEHKMQKLNFHGYTVLDKQGNPSSNGEVSMWLDNQYKLHIDPNYGDFDNGFDTVNVLENGKKNTLLNSSNNGKWTNNTSTVTTSHMSYLYKLNGKAVENRALAAHSAWFTDRYATINGVKMYRVATDEWVSSNDVK